MDDEDEDCDEGMPYIDG